MKANAEHFNSYEAVIDWLFVQLPNYQAQGTSAYKPGLDTIKALLNSIDNPQNNFKSIHLAGTNGKGSTAHMLASVYQEAAYKVGIFTSPHIIDFRERVKINGEMISRKQVVDFVNQTRAKIDELEATFFEITTALAIHIFAKEQVDIAIIETGLGGRLDSTNVLTPELSIITTIGLDHTQFLGDTIEEIAREKAGIIKQDVPVVLGQIEDPAKHEIMQIAKSLRSQLFYSQEVDFDSDLKGDYQKDNLSLAVSAIKILADILPVANEQIKKGLLKVARHTNFIGRYQQLAQEPRIILDAAHNTDGVVQLIRQVKQENKGQLHMIYGCSADKDMQALFSLFPKEAVYYFCEFDSPRSAKTTVFKELSNAFGLNADHFSSSVKALEVALKKSKQEDTILIFGSFYIMAKIISNFFQNR